MAVKLNQHDLQFILEQIKIAEAHSAGTPLADLVDSSLLPTGLRTVDGSYNNIVAGREQWGASGEAFPRLTDPNWVEGSGTLGGAPYPTNNDYGTGGDVVDGEPRLISNLIVDQTMDNPAAIYAALQHAGFEGDILTTVRDIHTGYKTNDKPAMDALEEQGDEAGLEQYKADMAAQLSDTYGIELDDLTIHLPNVAPDEGLSASYNAFFTFFGQFFDHGLDLVAKGGSGTVYMPLSVDDPLYNPDSPHTNFMVMTRATTDPDAEGNVTTPWVDQNQTYTSDASHQVFLREYVLSVDSDGDGTMDSNPLATGHLLDGARGLATWADVKEQAREMLGIDLTDLDVSAVPELRVDPYGEFIRGENGLPQILAAFDPAGNPIYIEGNRDQPVNPSAIQLPVGTQIMGTAGAITITAGMTVSAVRTGHAFLDDIAHSAVPGTTYDDDNDPTTPPVLVEADEDEVAGTEIGTDARGNKVAYDNELLDAHYITGDGRGNENIGLSAVHHIFHSEHNRQVDDIKATIQASGDADLIAQWTLDDGSWDGERLFQAARFTTEMQYQHLVFEEFARKIQPDVDVFIVQPDAEMDPSIIAEFAHVIYRFGHSMLNETVDIIDADGDRSGSMNLFDAFLNPLAFGAVDENGNVTVSHDEAAGAIVRGMTGQVGNEIDEFVTNTLRNQLLGIPLDLPAINIARGRDTGMPTLNEARAQFMEMAGGDTQLKPYESWSDFALNLKNPASIINFVAAYGTHPLIEAADTLEAKRDAAMQLVGLSDPVETTAASVENSSFETNSLATGQPGVITHVNGNYTTSAPDGWTLTGQGGLIDPAGGVVDSTGIEGTNVAWLRENGMLSQDTGQTLEEGASYRLTLDIGDRTNMEWPGGEARLVAGGVVLATVSLTAPAEDGGWATFSFETGLIDAAQAGQELSIQIQQTGGGADQMLVDNVRLDIARSTEITDRLDFLNGTGAWSDAETGLNNIDLWVGGLAEKKMPFGGMLGSTFSFVFEMQMESLQDADRFYYLSRVQGLNLLTELENNSLAKMALANTDLGETEFAIPADQFSVPDHVLYMDLVKQLAMTGLNDPEHEDPTLGAFTSLVERRDADGDGIAEFIRYNGADHVAIQGTDGDDTIVAGGGDDTVWGGDGDDRIEAGYGVDKINGGDGDDIITNSGTDIGEVDMLKGDDGNDVIHGGSGMALIFGGDGKDFLITGPDGSEIRAGEGDDFLLGGDGQDILFGNEGNDWVEGNSRFEYIAGDNGELFFNSTIIGHDVLNGGQGDTDYDADSGDDIMVAGEGIQKNIGMWGHDWVIHKGQQVGADADMNFPVFPNLPLEVLRDRFSQVEALSGWRHDDILRGDDRTFNNSFELETEIEEEGPEEEDLEDEDTVNPAEEGTNAPGFTVIEVKEEIAPDVYDPTPEGNFVHNELDQAGIDRIDGLAQIITADMLREVDYRANGSWENLEEGQQGDIKQAFVGGNILLGGGGSDLIEGRGGDDVIDGDAWLNVRISIRNDSGVEIATAEGMDAEVRDLSGTLLHAGRNLASLMLDRTYNPGQLHITREILYDDSGTDRAHYWDDQENYAFDGTSDGRLVVEHTMATETDAEDGNEGNPFDPITGNNRTSDGRDVLANIEELEFRDGVMSVTSGTNGADTLAGGGGNDIIVGMDGDDTINAGQGDDILIGGRGNDELNGGANDDRLVGGLGDDALNGGTGNDTYVFGLADGDDTINEAAGGGAEDRILLKTGGAALISLAAQDSHGAGGQGDLVIGYDDQQVSIADHYSGTNAQTGVEFINFDGGSIGGFDLGLADYRISRSDNANDNRNGTVENDFIAGENGEDRIAGAAGNDLLFGGDGNDEVRGGIGNDLLVGGGGDDMLFGGGGDDTVLWSVGDGSDQINGGGGYDTVHVTGDQTGETYDIYTRAEAEDAGITVAANTEIVITRDDTVIAELDNVEEIVINGMGGVDSFVTHGDFSATSLSYSTITLEGSEHDETVDISGLLSAHRIYFRSNGGNDTILGTLRPQDVIELPKGAKVADYSLIENEDGTTTFTNGDHAVTFTSSDGTPQFNEGDDDLPPQDDSDPDNEEPEVEEPEVDETETEAEDENTEDEDIVAPTPVAALAGTEGADALVGTADGDTIMGLGGRDVVFGHDGDDDIFGGDGADMLYGDDGDDRILGEDGNDFINAGAGDDTVFGGNGDDLFVAEAGDGDDTYYGDDMVGGSGNDTLDMSAIMASITADLGTGFMGRGSVSSAETGNDGLWGVENIVTGSGDDTITANSAVNVMDGGAGNDTFRFLSAADADGDTIMGFQPGDRIDLSGIDAHGCEEGSQSFTLVNDGFTGAGQLMFSHQTLDGEDYTVVQGNVHGNTTGDDDADFAINIKGRHELTVSDFNL